MPALTEMLEKPIRDPNGDEFGRIHDLVVRIGPDSERTGAKIDLYPPVTGLVARLRSPHGVRDVYIPYDHVRSLAVDGAQLTTASMNVLPFVRRDGEIVLKDSLLDKQVVDVEGRRVVRINDLDLAEREGQWRLVAVDVSPSAILRRLLPKGMQIGKISNRAPLIDWAQVVPMASGGPGGTLQLKVPRQRLEIMRPADLARVVEQLTPQQGADLLEEMDEAHAADTLEELDDEQQGQILRAMDPERAADVLDEMEPDEATDALQNITIEEAADLLGRMEREEATEVEELLGYPEDSAGGIMTTDYISVSEDCTIGDVIAALRSRARAAAAELDDPLPDAMFDIYVVAPEEDIPLPPQARRATSGRSRSRPRTSGGPAGTATLVRPLTSLEVEGRLVGSIALRDLVLNDPDARLSAVAKPVRSVAHPLDNEREVAHTIADEDLMALPVVDDTGMLLGIVTVDDAMDVILPTAWKKRIPRLFH